MTIGVSQSAPLAYLPGAITAANEISNWAKQSGFRTEVITDVAGTPVTIGRIREKLLDMLPQNDEVELFVLHFAGHGFRVGAEQNVWLPSDWYQEMRGISVEGLRRQLYRHGIRNLSIFSDACRSLPSDIDTADIVEDPVLPRGPYDAIAPVIDRFNAVVDGKQAYMLNGDQKSPARCIFSSALIEGLSGRTHAAFDKYLPDCVIPESLALFLQARLQEIGKQYRLNCSPEVLTGIPRDHVVYFQRGKIPDGNIPLPKWPTPPKNPDEDNTIVGWATGTNVNRVTFPDDEGWQIKALDQHVRKSFSIGNNFQADDINLLVLGATPKRVWAAATTRQNADAGRLGEYSIDVRENSAVQVLIEFHDGIVGSAIIYDRLITVLSRDKFGIIGWTCVNQWMDVQPQIESSIEVIAKLQLGKLPADAVDQIATDLREMKHINPTLGAIASYLYDYSGDTESIRRMAYFYCQHGQAIPFDISFMGLLPTYRQQSGYTADVPAVQARGHSNKNADLPNWITRSTPATAGKIAGFWPWLRQGWQFIEGAESEEKAVAENLRDVIPFLMPSQFSSFRLDGANILIRKFDMEANI